MCALVNQATHAVVERVVLEVGEGRLRKQRRRTLRFLLVPRRRFTSEWAFSRTDIIATSSWRTERLAEADCGRCRFQMSLAEERLLEERMTALNGRLAPEASRSCALLLLQCVCSVPSGVPCLRLLLVHEGGALCTCFQDVTAFITHLALLRPSHATSKLRPNNHKRPTALLSLSSDHISALSLAHLQHARRDELLQLCRD